VELGPISASFEWILMKFLKEQVAALGLQSVEFCVTSFDPHQLTFANGGWIILTVGQFFSI